MNTIRPISILLAAVFVAGCAGGKSPQTTATVEANDRWNAARSGVLLTLAEDQFEAGNLEKSRLTADEALALNPSDARLLVLRARIAVEQGRLEDADRDLDAAMPLMPGDAELAYLAGVVDERRQRPTEALAHYATAAAAAPDEAAYLIAHAEALVALDHVHQALALLNDNVARFEHSAPIRSAIAELHMRQGDFAEAAEMYRHASVLDRDDLFLRERLAVATYQAGRMREAELELGRLVKEPTFADRGDLWLAYGETLLAIGQFKDSRDAFLESTKLAPRNPATWSGLAKASIELGDARRATAAARQVEALSPQRADTHLLLGMSAQVAGEFDAALAAFRFAARLDPTDPLPACLEGRLLQQQGDEQGAAAAFQRALLIEPSDPLARQLLATLGG
ncbi:MAG: tetratricopeptide repeat protein [Planctomycetota bacterium]